MRSATSAVIDEHEASGRRFTAGGVQSFTLDAGDGEPVVCLHGVPTSSFLYRKVVPELAARGLRGIAFDLPGLGLAARPVEFDYSWTGLGRWALAAVDALDLDRFHLLVHDVGGPVGFEIAAAVPDRIASLTILNTWIDAANFRKPWVMRPFATPIVGRAWFEGARGLVFRQLMRSLGIHDPAAITNEELDAHRALVAGDDNGRAFLQIMRSFEPTQAKTDLYTSTVRDVPYPVQLVWGEHDPTLTLEHYGRLAQQITGVDALQRVPGRHFLQEDCAPEIAAHVAALVDRSAQQ